MKKGKIPLMFVFDKTVLLNKNDFYKPNKEKIHSLLDGHLKIKIQHIHSTTIINRFKTAWPESISDLHIRTKFHKNV